MAYSVAGIIAKREILEWHRGDYGWVRIAPLEQSYGLIPITDAVWQAVRDRVFQAVRQRFGDEDEEYPEYMFRYDLVKLAWTLADWLEQVSLAGPVAIVQVMCHGGDCEHGAAVWEAGERVLGPATMESFNLSFDNPVNQALRRIGVEVGDHRDAFAAIGLAGRRSLEAWEAAAT